MRRAAWKNASANKYHAVKSGGYDSKKEARRGQELLLLERAGKIYDLKRQVTYQLIPVQREEPTKGPRGGLIQGKVIERAAKYVADFVYTDAETGETVVEDAKGVRTPEYVLKRKLMLWIHGIRIREV